MKGKLRALLTGLGLFFGFVFFSYIVHKNLFLHFDFNTTVRLQDHMSRRFDLPFSWLSAIGGFEISSIILVLFLFFCRKLSGIAVLVLYGMIHVFEIYGKTFVEHFPPPHFLLRTIYPIDYPKFYVREEFSYPSGHAARASFITVLIGIYVYKSKKLSYIQKILIISFLIGYDSLMIISRVYLGEHWASDVIGGSMLGFSLSILSSLAL